MRAYKPHQKGLCPLFSCVKIACMSAEYYRPLCGRDSKKSLKDQDLLFNHHFRCLLANGFPFNDINGPSLRNLTEIPKRLARACLNTI